jgi:hypothetical protein
MYFFSSLILFMHICFRAFGADSVAANISQGADAVPRVSGLPPQPPTAASAAYQRHIAAQQQQQMAAAQAQLAQWQLAQQQLVQQQQQQQLMAQQQLALHQAMVLQQSATATGGPFYEHPSMYYIQQLGGASDGMSQCQQLPPELIEQYQQQLSEALCHQQSGSGQQQQQHMKTTVSADAINLMYQQAASGVGPPVSLQGWPPQAVGYNICLRRASDGQVHIVPAVDSSVTFYTPSSSSSAATVRSSNDHDNGMGLRGEIPTTSELPADIASNEEATVASTSDECFKVPNPPKPPPVCMIRCLLHSADFLGRNCLSFVDLYIAAVNFQKQFYV